MWNPFWQFCCYFPPRVQTSFNSNSKNFLGSHNFLIVLKTFLTKIAALLNLGKHEKRFLGKLRKKGLVFLEINKCSKLFCNESSKTFPSRVYYGFAKTQNAFRIRKSQNDWRSFFQKKVPVFQMASLTNFEGAENSGVCRVPCFSLDLQHERKILRTNGDVLAQKSPTLLGFKLMAVHFHLCTAWKNLKTLKRSSRLLKSSFDKPAD